MEPLIVPGIIANSQVELDFMLEGLKGAAKRVMLDVMDGEFVSNTSLNFDFELPQSFEYEAHLMVKQPLHWIRQNKEKIDIVIMHVETLPDIDKAIAFAKEKGLRVTLALDPETEIDVVLPYIKKIEAVLILTVTPGRYGAPFVLRTIEKIRRLRRIDPSLPIEVDGAMNPENARLARDAGATIFASGSYIMKSPDPRKAIKELENALKTGLGKNLPI
jgi:ribulose-phosphate 3-epimerase